MSNESVFSHSYPHRGSQLPVLDVYEGLEISMSQDGARQLTVFLTPKKAMLLAENLIRMAREKIEEDERHQYQRSRK